MHVSWVLGCDHRVDTFCLMPSLYLLQSVVTTRSYQRPCDGLVELKSVAFGFRGRCGMWWLVRLVLKKSLSMCGKDRVKEQVH